MVRNVFFSNIRAVLNGALAVSCNLKTAYAGLKIYLRDIQSHFRTETERVEGWTPYTKRDMNLVRS